MKGQDPHGRPKLRYRDQLKCSLKQACINLQSWEQLANDRAAWRRKIRDGVESFETARKQKDEDRRKRGHEKNNKPRPPPSILYHVTTTNTYSITGWAFKVTSAIVINHRWQSSDCRQI